MASRAGLFLTAWLLSALWLGAAVGFAAEAGTEFSYRDEFNSVSYAGNDGTHDFLWKWEERGDNGGPVGGLVRVDSSGCSGNCLAIGGDLANLEPISITRMADTAEAASIILAYEYRIEADNLTPTGGVRVMVSADGGRSWSGVRYYPIAKSKSVGTDVKADISEWASSQMLIGFFGVGQATGHITFDNIEIRGTVKPPDPTTTTSTSTTTTVPPTVTTTRPPTTEPPTTTEPPRSTTTTLATTTTTTAAGLGTPTTSPGGAEPQSQADLIAAGSRYTDKADLITTDLDTATTEDAPDAPAALSASPIEHATTGITIAASTLRTNALAAFALGILIALLALRGLARLDDRDT